MNKDEVIFLNVKFQINNWQTHDVSENKVQDCSCINVEQKWYIND